MFESLPVVDFLLKRLPTDTFTRPHARRMAEDCRTLLRSGVDWRKFEQETPRTLYLETTNICHTGGVSNACQCQSSFRRHRGVMTDQIFTRALCDYARMSGATERKEINFASRDGEPLTDPKISERVQLASEFGFRVTLFTNGILLHQTDSDSLLNAGAHRMVISTVPFDRENHERLACAQGTYDDLCAGVQKLLRQRNERNLPLRVSLRFRADIELNEIMRMPDFRRLILPHLRREEVMNLCLHAGGIDGCGQFKQSDRRAGGQRVETPLLKHRPCQRLFLPQVLYDGRVRACGGQFMAQDLDAEDKFLVGDLRVQTMGEIWAGAALHKLRCGFERGTAPPVCQSCEIYRSA